MHAVFLGFSCLGLVNPVGSAPIRKTYQKLFKIACLRENVNSFLKQEFPQFFSVMPEGLNRASMFVLSFAGITAFIHYLPVKSSPIFSKTNSYYFQKLVFAFTSDSYVLSS
jgi:hypothetical protein